jgi:glycosyltransferase involved in cell wall biosynthesis
MKILIVCRVLWPGGVQRMIFRQAEGLKLLGNEVDLVFIRDTGRYRYPTNLNYEIFMTKNRSSKVVDYILKRITSRYSPQRGDDAVVDIDYIRKFQKSISKSYDIIYYSDEFVALFSGIVKKKNKAKLVVIIHEPVDKNGSFLVKQIERKAVKNCDLVLTNSEEAKMLLSTLYDGKIEEIYLGTDVIDDVPDFDARKNYAISVTMWDNGRHPEKLIEIGSKLNVGKIILIGNWADNKYLEAVKRKIKEKSLDDRVEITGQVTEDRLRLYYKEAKCSIRFGYNEKGPGMGALESISWGIPIIFNNGIGIKEVACDQKNGFLVDLEDTDSIAKKITLLFDDKKNWEAMSKNNLILATSLSWNEHNKRLNKLFLEVTSK